MKNIYLRKVGGIGGSLWFRQLIAFGIVFSIGHNACRSNGEVGYSFNILQRKNTAL